jgi:predicted porin
MCTHKKYCIYSPNLEKDMKKTLVSLAVLGSIATGAQAQVTLYGIADVALGRGSVTALDGTKTTENFMESGGLSGSRLGFMGSKDLGNGLTGVFKLEHGFNVDTGEARDTEKSFNRQAYVGLAGGFGQVTFGNTWTAMDDVLGAANSGFDSAAMSASNNVLGVQAIYQSNPGNTIKYTSPSFNGLTMGASHSLSDENGRKFTDVSLSYAAGDMAANVAYQNQASTGQFEPWDLLALNASYNFGVVKFLASVGVVDAADERITDWQIGFDFPVSKALTVSAGYAYSEDNDELGGGNRKGFGVGATYNLADTTTLYGGYRQAEARDGGEWLYEQQKSNVVSIGIKHTF